MAPQPPISERRHLPRFPVRQIVTIKSPGYGLQSWDEDPDVVVQTGICNDLNANGIFVWLESPIPSGSRVEIIMAAPPEIMRPPNVDLRCIGNVLRIERDLVRGKIGVAVAFVKVDLIERKSSP